MKLTTLEDVIKSLETMETKVGIEDRIRIKARVALNAMVGKG